MYATLHNVTFDCADAGSLSAFWAAVTGGTAKQTYSEHGRAEYAVVPPAGEPRLYFAEVPEHKRAKNRVHLDLSPPGDQRAEVARLVGLGATVLPDQPEDAGWIVLADPEGNEFCLEPGSPG